MADGPGTTAAAVAVPRSSTRLRRAAGRASGTAALLLLIGLLATVGIGHLAGYRTFVVRSGSMGAAAPTGSVVLAHSTPAVDVAVGDVILVRRDDQYPVLHRVVERVQQDGRIVVRTKGDANPHQDTEQYLLAEETATLAGVVPGLGYVVALLRTPAGWFGLVVLPALLLILRWLRRYWSSGA